MSSKNKKRTSDQNFDEGDNDIAPAKVSKNVPEWTTEETLTLISNIKANVGDLDTLRYFTAAKKLKWQNVAFNNRDEEQCQARFNEVIKKVLRFRTLKEITDAVEKHINNNLAKSEHPQIPKRPMTVCFRYITDKRAKYAKLNPTLTSNEVVKLLSDKFKELSKKKLAKYKKRYKEERVIYKKKMKEFRKAHPEYIDLSRPRIDACHLFDKPQSPFCLFKAEKLEKIGKIDPETKGEVLVKIKAHWDELSDSKRVKWIRKAQQREANYLAEMKEFCSLHPEFKPPPVRSVITKYEKDLKDTFDGKPEMPPQTGFTLFKKNKIHELPDMKMVRKWNILGQRWKQLSSEERNSYKEQAKILMDEYKERFKAYVEQLPEEERVRFKPQRPYSRAVKNKTKSSPDDGSKDATALLPQQNLIETVKVPAMKNTTTLLPQQNSTEAVKAAAVKNATTVPLPEQTSTESVNSPAAVQPNGLHEYELDKLEEYEVKYPTLSKNELINFIASEYDELPYKKKKKYQKKALKNSTIISQPQESIKKPGYKNEPKKPPKNANRLFKSEMLSIMINTTPVEKMSKVSKKWNELSESAKDDYRRRVEAMNRRYSKDYVQFMSSMSAQEYAAFKAAKDAVKEKKKEKKKSASKKSKDNAVEQGVEEEEKQKLSVSSDSSRSEDENPNVSLADESFSNVNASPKDDAGDDSSDADDDSPDSADDCSGSADDSSDSDKDCSDSDDDD